MLIYIASPYSHADIEIMNKRVGNVSYVVAFLLNFNYHVISPVLHNHTLCMNSSLHNTTDWTHWKRYCISILEKCDELWVFKDDGWDTSIGVTAEIEFAKNNNIKIKYFTVDNEKLIFC